MNKKNSIGIIVIATFIIQFVVFTVTSNLMPVLQPTIMEYQSISGSYVTQFSLIYTVGVIISAVAAPFIPMVYKAIGIKASYMFGSALAGLSFLAMAFIPQTVAGSDPTTSIYFYWIAAAGFNVGTAFVSSIGIPYLITKWYPVAQKGKMMGLAFMGGSIGNVFAMGLFQVISPSVDNIKMLIIVFGIVAAAVGIIISLLFIKDPTSQEMEIIHSEDSSTTKSSEVSELPGETLMEAFKTPKFWMFAGGLILLGLYVAAMATQYPTFYKQLEGGKEIYLTIGLVFAFASVLGNFLGGFLFDKIGVRATLLFGAFLAGGAALILIFSQTMPQLGYVFGVFKGLSVFTYIILPGYMVGFLFGQKNYGQILGICQMIFALGFAAGSAVFSALVAATSWNTGWIVVGGFVAGCYVLFILASLTVNAKEASKNVVSPH